MQSVFEIVHGLLSPDLTTAQLNTPEAIKGLEYYANLLKTCAPRGVLTYTEDQARLSLLTGGRMPRTSTPLALNGDEASA